MCVCVCVGQVRRHRQGGGISLHCVAAGRKHVARAADSVLIFIIIIIITVVIVGLIIKREPIGSLDTDWRL